MSAVTPSAAQLQETFGVLFAGYSLAVIGYGFTCFQTYLHFFNSPNNSGGAKALVFTLFALDTASSVLLSDATYFYMVVSLPYIGGMAHIVPKFTVVLLLTATSTFAVQTYYAVHVRQCDEKKLLGARRNFCHFHNYAGTCHSDGCSDRSLKDPLFASWSSSHMKVVISLTQAFNFLAALAIFGALTKYGRAEQQNSRTSKHIKQMDDLLTHFISNGLLGAGFQFAGLLAVRHYVPFSCLRYYKFMPMKFVARPHRIAWIPFHFLANKVAINGLLYLLNLQSKSMDQVNEASFMGSELFARRPSVSRTIQISQGMTFMDESESVKGVPNQTDTFGDMIPTDNRG
ncbi:hypothetical protein MVEN_02555800 [Mycena venus]|uniref:Uncharacterized protein n=1 Tax=Mycena venus TaxID=2733690 RepID=A0A8H6U3E7_9AGAR|nr:hypothetical protein MVEN_02555800 [Mycena venus]